MCKDFLTPASNMIHSYEPGAVCELIRYKGYLYRTANLSERRMRLKVSELTAAHRVSMAKVRVVGPGVDAAEAKALIDSGKAIILDVVASHVWPAMTRAIQDSIRIPPEEIQERYGELPRDRTIITYCT